MIIQRELTVTEGNLRHHHLYLRPVIDLIPTDALGGSNVQAKANKTVRVYYGTDFIDTDVVREKQMFRRRRWIRLFFSLYEVKAGDIVLLEQMSPYVFRLLKRDPVLQDIPIHTHVKA